MKNLLIVLALTFVGCSSTPQVRLLGQYEDPNSEVRWELYLRAVSLKDSSQLAHDKNLEILISEANVKQLVNSLRKCQDNPELLGCPMCKRPY